MPPFSPPFPYLQFLIGEEILYRTLNRQRDHATHNRYGMTWGSGDDQLLIDTFNRAQVMRASFSIGQAQQTCLPLPPCFWDKTGDDIHQSDVMQTLFRNLPGTSYLMEIYARTDHPNQSGYDIGNLLIRFQNDQSQLTSSAQTQFLYYSPVDVNGFTPGLAVWRTHLNPGSTSSVHYDYLFNFVI